MMCRTLSSFETTACPNLRKRLSSPLLYHKHSRIISFSQLISQCSYLVPIGSYYVVHVLRFGLLTRSTGGRKFAALAIPMLSAKSQESHTGTGTSRKFLPVLVLTPMVAGAESSLVERKLPEQSTMSPSESSKKLCTCTWKNSMEKKTLLITCTGFCYVGWNAADDQKHV